jgi:hypothetical protein
MSLDTTHFSRNDTKTSLREKRRKAVKTWRYRVPIFEKERRETEKTSIVLGCIYGRRRSGVRIR